MKSSLLGTWSVLAGLTVLAVSGAFALGDDPLIHMPGTQPDQGITLYPPSNCAACHENYDPNVEPGFNWKGSMMAQSARDPLFWAAMTVAAQDSIWAFGDAKAADMCLRCHMPEGWLAGRSEPFNGSAMTGSDFDGVHCDMCHRMWDPFFETTFDGSREGNDWPGYWDEQGTESQPEANLTYAEDDAFADDIKLFSGSDFFDALNLPAFPTTYTENSSGQYFVTDSFARRASFADPVAPHLFNYSRYHKSKYFCASCHDTSNSVLANLGHSSLPDLSGGTALISEQYSSARYFHLERTFSEFMLSAYGAPDGAPTNAKLSNALGVENAKSCQDCHMRDTRGKGCAFDTAPIRPDESTEHPNSGLPLHDLTGGNCWMTHILASLDPNGPVYDPVNVQILDKGPAILTLDLDAGESPKNNGAAIYAGAVRAREMLRIAATVDDVQYDRATGALGFKVRNHTGHKLLTGYPEGRRLWINIKAYAGGALVEEVNPYDMTVGTLKGLPYYGGSPPLGSNESYSDELVYEMHSKSDITGELAHSFHFSLVNARTKDNRIPPRGFDIANAPERESEPVTAGVPDPGYFTAQEYAGGYDEVSMTIPAGAHRIELTLYYQGTTREYIEFLRNEINGTGGTLPPEAYIAQTDPFFTQLKAWGETIWDLWEHNHGLDGGGVEIPGIVPEPIATAAWPPSIQLRNRPMR